MRTYFDASVTVALFMHDTFSERADEFGRSGAVVPVVSDFGAAEFSFRGRPPGTGQETYPSIVHG